MDIWKTDKTDLTPEEIERYIERHQHEEVPEMDDMWEYYEGENPYILHRPKTDPDNRSPFAYGRKIVNTFTGYAYRPGYITYKGRESTDDAYVAQIQEIFDLNHEPIKTERDGRNTAVFGVSYELHYVGRGTTAETLSKALPRFFNVDPRSIILLYDMEPEPNKAMGIRYFPLDDRHYKVEHYTADAVRVYDRIQNANGKWDYVLTEANANFYSEVPITPFYMGDDPIGLIKPVAKLIDDFDILCSDSMVEFQRFANAYLRIVGMSLGDPTGDNPKALKAMLARIKSTRIFEQLKAKDDVTFLTKDIPKDFIEFMTSMLRKQIHVQSHVPDFAEMGGGTLSGAAVQRLLFDFENVCSSAEADFDTGLNERISLINTIYGKARKPVSEGIVIQHKRNIPLNAKDFADTALVMKQAGFSRETIASIIPDDILPDVQEELARQEKEAESMFPSVDEVATVEEVTE